MAKFKPKKGQIDYTHARFAPVINCVLKFREKYLIVKRSENMFNGGFWTGICGFLDDQKSIKEKVADELMEELGITEENIIKIILGKIFHDDQPQYKKTWIVHPILVEVNTDKIRLDWEAQNYAWVDPREIKKFNLSPGFDRVLMNLSIEN